MCTMLDNEGLSRDGTDAMSGVDFVALGKKIVRRIFRMVYPYVTWPLHCLYSGMALGYLLWLRQYGRHRIGARPISMESPPTIVMLVVTALDRDPRVACDFSDGQSVHGAPSISCKINPVPYSRVKDRRRQSNSGRAAIASRTAPS